MRRLVVLILGFLVAMGTSAAPITPAQAADGTLTGTVELRETGTTNPFPDVSIQILQGSTEVASTTTDASGSYSVEVESGTYDVVADPPDATGLSASTRSGISIPASVSTQVDFLFSVVESRVEVRGTVTNSSGDPVGFAQISLTGPEFNDGDSTRTAADGTYALSVLPRSPYRLRLTPRPGAGVPDRYLLTANGLDILEPKSLDIELPMHPVRLIVEDSAGAGLPDAGLTVNGGRRMVASGPRVLGSSSQVEAEYRSSIPVDASGSATVALLPGDFDVTAAARLGGQHVASTETISIPGGPYTFTLAEPVPPGKARIKGRVLDGSGLPVSGAQVHVIVAGQAGTGSDGRFDDEVNAGTNLQVQVRSFGMPGTAPYTEANFGPIDLPEGSTRDFGDLQFPLTTTIVRVLDPDGNPVGRAKMQEAHGFPNRPAIEIGGYQAIGTSSYRSDVETSSDGRVPLHLFPSDQEYEFGVYARSVTCVTGDEWDLDDTSFKTKATSDGQLIVRLEGEKCQKDPATLEPGAITGEIQFDGVPLTDVSASVSGCRHDEDRDETESDGIFLLNVCPKDFNLQLIVPADDGRPRMRLSTSVTVSPGETRDLGVINLTSRGTLAPLSITVVDPFGEPIKDVEVSTYGVSVQELEIGGLSFRSRSDYPGPLRTGADGKTVLLLHPADGYQVNFTPPPGYEFLRKTGVNLPGGGALLQVQLATPHAPPVATYSVTGSTTGTDEFADPVMVSISADVAPGFELAALEFSLDGSSPAPYTGAFPVTGLGEHVVRVRATDSGSVRGDWTEERFTLVESSLEPPVDPPADPSDPPTEPPADPSDPPTSGVPTPPTPTVSPVLGEVPPDSPDSPDSEPSAVPTSDPEAPSTETTPGGNSTDDPAQSMSPVAATGSDMALVALGSAFLLAVGLGLVLTGRRRPHGDHC